MRAHARRQARPWLLHLLGEELAPYPGRASLVVRMVLSSTLTMLVIMTFHLPSGALGGFFALLFSRQDFRATLQQGIILALCFTLGTVYVILTLTMVVDSPVSHFLWVLASLYLCFFVITASRVYAYSSGFVFTLAGAIPLWDGAANVNAKISLTLYTLLSVAIASGASILVEAVCLPLRPADPVTAGLADRLRVAGAALLSAAGARPISSSERRLLARYAAVGASALRQQVVRSGLSGTPRARASAAIAMVDRITGLCALLLSPGRAAAPPADGERCGALGLTLQRQSAVMRGLRHADQLGSVELFGWAGRSEPSPSSPLLAEVERSVQVLSEVYEALRVTPIEDGPALGAARGAKRSTGLAARLFVEGALHDPQKHLFALRGMLAASLCYLVYNGVDWPGISTALATCIITALGTIGASRQKQVLRIVGAVIGGFVVGLPAQVFLLPQVDSVTAFTLFFVAVTALASWIATASPRLSYLGLQLALAFDLINLQEPYRQTSLSIGRDRVVGVLLGLSAMWLVFERLGAARASDALEARMRQQFQLLADAADALRALRQGGDPRDAERFDQIRGSANAGFTEMNSQADALLFEFGRKRRRNLNLRRLMLSVEMPMRSVFLLLIALYEVTPIARRLRTIERTTPLLAPFLERCRDALALAAQLRLVQSGDRLELDPTQAKALEDAGARIRDALEQGRATLARESPTLLSLCTSMENTLRYLLANLTTPQGAASDARATSHPEEAAAKA